MHESVRVGPFFKDCTEGMGERDGFVRAMMLEDLAEEVEVARGGGQEGAVSASCGACRKCSCGETPRSRQLPFTW